MQGFFAKSCIFFGSSFTVAYYTIKYDTVKMFQSFKYKLMIEDWIKAKDRKFVKEFVETQERRVIERVK